jgi:uncharacterized repeat protein (TIGR01451 family)
VTCTTCDGRTTTPIVLSPGDVYLNADFGYQPTAGNGATIGDTIWEDSNRNNTQDAGEPVIPGVTVALVRDLNGNGVWNAGEPIIATTLTNSSGQYQFSGVPVTDGTGTDDYLVWVNDTSNVLNELSAVYDSDGANPASGLFTGLGISVVGDLTPAGNLLQDFAYVPKGHTAGAGLIGDTVWLDLNGNGSLDAGEGLEGIKISLLNSSNKVIAQAVSNENGQYFFGGLAAGTYTVEIETTTLPNFGIGLVNFVDPDGGTPSQALVTIGGAQPLINLNQDFGYNKTSSARTLSGTIWNDSNADGTKGGAETAGYSGVTVALYTDSNDNGVLDSADALVGATTTNASGDYSFTGLPDDTYFVDVTDNAKLLNGYWHSLGATPGADNNSQTDPYTVVLAGANNATADFGYYRTPAAVGDYVWNDLDRDGIQDAGEPGIPNALVTLTISWPAGGTTTLNTLTDANGLYNFGNLLLDEDFDGAGGGEPTFSVTFTPPVTYVPTLQDQGGNDALDSDGTNVTATLTKGVYNNTIDSGFKQVVQIGDTIWQDLDADGSQSVNEPGLSGVIVELSDGTCTVGVNCPTRTTDSNGYYLFDDQPTGTYIVIVRTASLPGGAVQTGDPDGTFDNQTTINASTPGVYINADFGYRGTGSIGDYVWNDMNGNAAQDTGEVGLSYVQVYIDANGNNTYDSGEPTTYTNSLGFYQFNWLFYGAYSIRTVPPAGMNQTYDLNGGLDNEANITLNAGNPNPTNVDFGYQYPGLSIAKASSAAGSVNPGDMITYTLTVRNNSGILQTGIIISDTLPAGTTYVPNSTVATGYQINTGAYLDQFNNQNYSNNQGTLNWTGNWQEVGDDGSPTAGSVFVYNDTTSTPPNQYVLSFTRSGSGNQRSAYRQANLTTCSNAILTFDYRIDENLESNDSFIVEASTNATTGYSTIWTITPGNAFNTYATSGNISLNGYNGAPVYVRFSSIYYRTGGGDNDEVHIDNVQISCTSTPTAITKDNITGGANPDLVNGTPASLVLAGDNFGLNPGQSMKVTFKVIVNNPVPGGLSAIDNTASVASEQQTTPQRASTHDILPTQIGNLVWLDEDGNGYQDAGEAGIPNVTVQLWNSTHTAIVATTTTDANGGYIFKDVTPGIYQVDVLNSSLPTGLVQTTVIGGSADNTNKADPYTLTTIAGSEAMQADFGFNWAPSSDTDGNTGTGAIGDRLWIDANGNGLQDPGEPGLYNVSVQLLTPGVDGILGTADDVVAATTTSNYCGNYIFDGLAAGAYTVRVNGGSAPAGYTQTGDPDQPGALCTTCDNRTTTPILLAPGDVFVNADFGYQPTAGNGSNIGDTLWVDANRNNSLDANEPRLAGVTVSLIRDLNGNGVRDAGEPVIATTLTNASGQYLFSGVPVADGVGTDDYLVWVNDIENVLFGLIPTYDSNGTGTPNLSAVSNLAPAGDLNQDFAYAPPGHDSGEGLIGDTIFYDRDASGTFSPGEGMEGVRVELYRDTNGDGNYDAGEPLLASTFTNENGQYFFGGLPAGNYVVKVNTSTLPAGVTNTVDQGDATLNEGGVTLAAGGVNLNQDFGYRDTSSPNSISGTIWRDTDTNGVLGGGEAGRFQNVTVVLRNSSGNIVATTTTDANGNYSFNNLPDGAFTVDVTDDNNALDGYWHSLGTPGSDNNSQVDPYTVVLSGNTNNATADFGYYRDPATVGNFVWLDRNGDGIQDAANEPGIQGVEVVLTITYPNASVVTLKTKTGANGAYSFGNLLLDEDFNSSGGGLVYTISMSNPTSMTPSPQNQTSEDLDSDNPAGEVATVIKGATSLIYDFGFSGSVDLGDLPQNISGSPDFPTYFAPGPSNVVFPDGPDADTNPDTTDGVTAVWLGLSVDTEADGQPNAYATGDGADEDGLIYNPSTWVANSTADVTVIVNSSAPTTVYFGLWIDWNFDGVFDAFYNGSGTTASPTNVIVTIDVPAGYTQTTVVFLRLRGSTSPLSSGDYVGTMVNGEVEDYRWPLDPTAVTLTRFEGFASPWQVTLTWETAFEFNTLGYNIYRSTSLDGPREQINSNLIPSQIGKTPPFIYQLIDSAIQPGVTYYYWLEEVDINGKTLYEPIQITGQYGIFLPILQH